MTSAASSHPASGGLRAAREAATETKPPVRTTELLIYLTAVVAVIITSIVVSGKANSPDPFNAEQALRYITFLTIGYMVSRGLAKAGSREPHTEGR